MKTCRRLLNFVQIINAEGDIRLCGWNNHNIVGNLLDEDLVSILRGERAQKLRQMIANGDYSFCPADNCPYIANDNLEAILTDYSETEIGYPKSLYLAYEGNCNYNCTCCTSYQHMADTRSHDYTENYDKLEERLRPILPYVRHIGANGRGELFASPRIMKLLSEWKPISPVGEVSVSLETNGSLFNERNWAKISNLGQYQLRVAITVMSFDERTYQYLSGTKQPISQLLESLKFVKSLREQQIINHLELATVMQELNFREMPEFTHRCLEEFGADTVRIRPIMRGGPASENIQWFADVRNPLHPHYELFRKVMADPIFHDPRVLLWSGKLDSEHGRMPLESRLQKMQQREAVLSHIEKLVRNENLTESVRTIAAGRKVALYGIGTVGKILAGVLKEELYCVFDKYSEHKEYRGIPIKKEVTGFEGLLIVTPYGRFQEIKKDLLEDGFAGEVISLEELILNQKGK